MGAQLVADAGTYAGGAVETYLFQWRRCDKTGGGCVDVAGATGQTYGVRSADLNHTLRVEVTAKNDYGSTVNESKPTTVVQTATAPAVTTTVAASRTTTICCQTVRLNGHVSSNRAGEPITIIAGEFDQDITNTVAKTVTDTSGNWTAVVKLRTETTYTAQTSTSLSRADPRHRSPPGSASASPGRTCPGQDHRPRHLRRRRSTVPNPQVHRRLTWGTTSSTRSPVAHFRRLSETRPHRHRPHLHPPNVNQAPG